MQFTQSLGYLVRGTQGLVHSNTEHLPQLFANTKSFPIGSSVRGKDMTCYKIGDGPMPILFGGGIHGNEQGSVRFVFHLLAWLDTHAIDFPHYIFYVVPILNPDGYIKAQRHPDYWRGGMIGRFNANTVDLNRNFPTPSFQSKSTWGRGKNYQDKTEVFCGPHGASEPETQALIRFVKDKNIQFCAAFHNAAAAVLGNALPHAQKASRIFSAASGYSLEGDEEWRALGQTGTAKEWFELQNIPYLEIEGRYRWGSDYAHQLAGIRAVLSDLNKI